MCLTHLKVQHLSCLSSLLLRVRLRLAWASPLSLSRSCTVGPVRHSAMLPLSCVPKFEHMEIKRSHCFWGEHKKSLSSIFSALFLIVAWATIHAYVSRLCAINYVVLHSQALAGDNSHPHISDLWAVHRGPPAASPAAFKHAGPQQCHSPCVIAPICAESTCISVMCQPFISHHLSQPATCCTKKVEGGKKSS